MDNDLLLWQLSDGFTATASLVFVTVGAVACIQSDNGEDGKDNTQETHGCAMLFNLILFALAWKFCIVFRYTRPVSGSGHDFVLLVVFRCFFNSDCCFLFCGSARGGGVDVFVIVAFTTIVVTALDIVGFMGVEQDRLMNFVVCSIIMIVVSD